VPPAQPAAIAAAVANYRTGATAWHPTTQPPPARQLGDLAWRGSGQGELAGLPVVAHTYQDPAGRSVVLLQAVRSFPQAHGASHQPPGTTWTAEVRGLALFCADRPAPSLLLGDDQSLVLAAAQRLGLH